MIKKLLALSILMFAYPFAASADITTNMVGDARDGIPDNLEVAVTTVIVDGVATVTVNLDAMALTHPDVTMQNFFFNMVGSSDDYVVAIVAPSGWVVGDGTNAQGSGSADFMFEWIDAPGGERNNIDVSQNLVFTIRLVQGDIADANFTGAARSMSDVGNGQIGAHLRSLSGGCSGFVWGNWTGTSDTPVGQGTEEVCGSTTVPEPGTLGLLGLGLLGMGLRRRRIVSN